MTANPDKKVMDYPGLDTSVFATNETVKNFLISSQPGTKRIDKPVYVIQGTADTNVPYPITQALVANLKTLGSPDVTLDPVIRCISYPSHSLSECGGGRLYSDPYVCGYGYCIN